MLSDVSVSREHAVIFFDGNGWLVRDLSSRNGTFVGGCLVSDSAALEVDSIVSFGSEANTWRVVDANPPSIRARSPTQGTIAGSASGLFLPDGTSDTMFVSYQDGQWVLEKAGQLRQVQDGELLTAEGGPWTLELTLGDHELAVPTAAQHPVEPTLCFNVSRDEEHVAITIEHDRTSRELPHRSHSYLLLLLARARFADQASTALSLSEHGWLETKQLADALRTNTEQINVWIFRAREQFQKLAPALAERLIERRPSLGQLRIGFGNFSISTS